MKNNLGFLYIGNFTNDELYSVLLNNNVKKLSEAAKIYQKNFIATLISEKVNLKIISIIPSDEIANKYKRFEYLECTVDLIGYGKNLISSIIKISKIIYTKIKQLNAKKIIVINYSVNPLAIIPLLIIKVFIKIELVTICSEIPILRRCKRNIKNILKYRVLNLFNKKFDKYIIFTDKMKEYLPSNKKYFTIEGFCDGELLEKKYTNKNIVLYAGGLAYDNGIHLMIEAVGKSKLIDELWICGAGECEDYVKQSQNKKIKYFGRLPHSKVREMESQAKILLNVRNPDERLTKYSFPSKIIEYLSSGTLVISTMLEGVPMDYYRYIYLLNTYNSTELANMYDMIFNLNETDYLTLSCNAQQFILSKTPENACKKIYSFLIS